MVSSPEKHLLVSRRAILLRSALVIAGANFAKIVPADFVV
jgi:hypothetical protein